MNSKIEEMLTSELDSWATKEMVTMSTEDGPTEFFIRRVKFKWFGGRMMLVMFQDKSNRRCPTRFWTFTTSSFAINQDGMDSGSSWLAMRHFLKEEMITPEQVAYSCGGVPVRMWLTPSAC